MLHLRRPDRENSSTSCSDALLRMHDRGHRDARHKCEKAKTLTRLPTKWSENLIFPKILPVYIHSIEMKISRKTQFCQNRRTTARNDEQRGSIKLKKVQKSTENPPSSRSKTMDFKVTISFADFVRSLSDKIHSPVQHGTEQFKFFGCKVNSESCWYAKFRNTKSKSASWSFDDQQDAPSVVEKHANLSMLMLQSLQLSYLDRSFRRKPKARLRKKFTT